MSNMTRVFTVACATVALLSACSGGAPTENNIVPPPPPPVVPETLIVSVTASVVLQQTGAFISISVSAVSNKGAVNPTCTMDGVPSTCGMVSATVGNHTVCTEVKYVTTNNTKVSCASQVSVPQTTVSGKVVVADLALSELAPRGIRVRFFRGADTVSTDVLSTDGSFQVNLGKLAGQDSLSCIVDAIDSSNRLYHPRKCAGTITKDISAKPINLVLVPFTVLIPSSCSIYGGTQVPFDINKAYIAGGDGMSFYPRTLVNGVWNYRTASHKNLPQSLAFRNDLGDIPITASDSVAAWIHINTLNKYLCMDAFRPANKSEITNIDGVNVYVMSTFALEAGGVADYIGNGEYGSGIAIFRTLADLLTKGNGGRFRHELVHFLGFLHGCGWAGLQSSFCEAFIIDNTGFIPGLPSQYDVVYIQMMYKVRELERKYNGLRCSIMEEDQGEREFIKKLAPEKVVCQ